MAHVLPFSPKRPAVSGLGRLFMTLGGYLTKLAETNSRVRRADTLNALSDAELAKRGLKREDIVRHIWGDVYFI